MLPPQPETIGQITIGATISSISRIATQFDHAKARTLSKNPESPAALFSDGICEQNRGNEWRVNRLVKDLDHQARA